MGPLKEMPTSVAKVAPKRTPKAKRFKGNFVLGVVRDLPDRTMEENEQERQVFFAEAWEKKRAREAAKAAVAANPAGEPVAKPVAKPVSEKARIAAFNDSDSD